MIKEKILTYLSRACEGLLSLFFPPLCLYCKEKLEHSRYLYCRGCCAYFELIDPRDYCPYCGGETENGRACLGCVKEKCWKVKCGSALEEMGPPLTFLYHLSRGQMTYLCRTAASFMTIQYFSFKWKEPHIIIPIRLPWWKRQLLGSDPAYLIAKELSRLLNISLAARFGSKRSLRGKRALFIDLNLDRLEWVKRENERLELEASILFSLVKTYQDRV